MFTPLAFAISALFTGCSSCNDQQIIEKEPIDEESLGFQNNWGSWLGSGTLSNGAPVLSYYDKTKGALGIAVGTISNEIVEWTHTEIDGYTNDQGLDSGDRGKFSSLVIANDDRIWISYHDVGLKNLRYATQDPSTGEWSTGLADTGGGGSPFAGLFSSIALDANNNPVIAHYDQFRTDLRVVHYDGSSFSAEVVDEGPDATDPNGGTIEGDTGQFTDIIIDNGVEMIVYLDKAAGDLKLAYGVSGAYTIETIDSEGEVGAWPSITAHDGTYYIAYHDMGSQNLKLAMGVPGAWTTETIDDSKLVGADTAIHVDGDGITITYFDGQSNDAKRAVKTANEDWIINTIAAEGALGYHNELLKIGDKLYAACHNYTTGKVWFSELTE